MDYGDPNQNFGGPPPPMGMSPPPMDMGPPPMDMGMPPPPMMYAPPPFHQAPPGTAAIGEKVRAVLSPMALSHVPRHALTHSSGVIFHGDRHRWS
eukprot:gene18262-24716_t